MHENRGQCYNSILQKNYAYRYSYIREYIITQYRRFAARDLSIRGSRTKRENRGSAVTWWMRIAAQVYDHQNEKRESWQRGNMVDEDCRASLRPSPIVAMFTRSLYNAELPGLCSAGKLRISKLRRAMFTRSLYNAELPGLCSAGKLRISKLRSGY
ncbi:hypothetical protein QE152_g31118 [Popillia japonica]|uniref:Uncharacterized protein n=1 Tax=Popillia japonica TaxID=7064 RepID=A0AAW1JCD4_POPJA